tara:strand:+ start:92 stop:310 length:219 start_codon:yes stop_codon:yes gene_type:complete
MSKTQNQQILNYLKNGNSITPLEALQKFNCFRLSARIFNLREDGFNIITNYITDDNKTYAEYRFISSPTEVK